jgi:hypothetical protein
MTVGMSDRILIKALLIGALSLVMASCKKVPPPAKSITGCWECTMVCTEAKHWRMANVEERHFVVFNDDWRAFAMGSDFAKVKPVTKFDVKDASPNEYGWVDHSVVQFEGALGKTVSGGKLLRRREIAERLELQNEGGELFRYRKRTGLFDAKEVTGFLKESDALSSKVTL